MTASAPKRSKEDHALDEDPLWYKDAVIYELHVRAFCDSDSDGIGDFRGLTEKLDYLHDLGVTAIWLLPFYPSPLKDDGYDISDYLAIHSSYGVMRDFKAFVREAHKRGLRVITELVLNHTSAEHAWFRRARLAAPGSKHRDFYVWNDSPEKYLGARIIFKDFESSNWAWDPVAKSYYWHRFYTHQPDLNFENPDVVRAALQVLDYWFEIGVDGLRLDAVPYLFEREGTNCENLPETHAFLKRLRAHIDEKFDNRMLLAEANQWPDDAVGYFGDGDECHMAFHFPVMPRLFMAIRMEDRYPIIDILEETPEIHEDCQWALFLRNHDELTLEMVTDEDRDYMYRAYAQDAQARINLGIRRRLAPLLGNSRRRIELMNGLLFSLPGTPVIYYGDEIGMGDNVYQGDRNGVRTPMQWNGDRNAGFSRANPQQLYLPVIIDPEYHYETVNVEAQQANPHSLLWWMKRVIALRKRHKAFGRGTIEFLQPENHKVLAFLRRLDGECILVVANLSRFVQAVEIDLSEFEGFVPVEIFGHTEFPPVGGSPYFVTLGPHSFYWFSLEQQSVELPSAVELQGQLPVIKTGRSWNSVFSGTAKADLEAVLPNYVKSCRWFAGKARRVRSVRIDETISVAPPRGAGACLAFLHVDYLQGEPETYLLPLAYATAEDSKAVLESAPQAAVALLEVQGSGEPGLLYDALWQEQFRDALLAAIAGRRRLRGTSGELVASATRSFRRLRGPASESLPASVMSAEQSNTSVVYDARLVLKLFRRPEPGINPDLEIGRFLSERQAFEHVPAVAGAIEYRRGRAEPMTVGVLVAYVPNEGDAWEYTLDSLDRFYERALANESSLGLIEAVVPAITESQGELEEATALVSPYAETAKLLGRRTAELHVALAQGSDEPDFAPERITEFYRRSLYQSMRSLAVQNLQLLRTQRKGLAEGDRELAGNVLDRETAIMERFQGLTAQPIHSMRIRCHGDYHLRQVLFTGKDFVIIDFEGEPAKPLSERRLKRSPLQDVAGMLRSFHYAAHAALLQQQQTGIAGPEQLPALELWAQFWHSRVSTLFLDEYIKTPGIGGLLPERPEELRILLDVFLLGKAIYELGYELNNRPDWVRIPLLGIVQLLNASE